MGIIVKEVVYIAQELFAKKQPFFTDSVTSLVHEIKPTKEILSNCDKQRQMGLVRSIITQ
jgi:hypothetical protein